MLEREFKGNDLKNFNDFNQVVFVSFDFIQLVFHLFQNIGRGFKGYACHDNVKDFHFDINAGSLKSFSQIFDQVFLEVVRVLTNNFQLV